MHNCNLSGKKEFLTRQELFKERQNSIKERQKTILTKSYLNEIFQKITIVSVKNLNSNCNKFSELQGQMKSTSHKNNNKVEEKQKHLY